MVVVMIILTLAMIVTSAIPKKGAAIASIPVSALAFIVALVTRIVANAKINEFFGGELTSYVNIFTFTFTMWIVIPIIVLGASIARAALCAKKANTVQGQYQYTQYQSYQQGGYNG